AGREFVGRPQPAMPAANGRRAVAIAAPPGSGAANAVAGPRQEPTIRGSAMRRAKTVPDRNIIAAPRESAEPPTASARALGEAVAALRRGEPVLIRDAEISVLTIAAELATKANLARLREVSRAPARVVLTRRRAVALGLAPRTELSGAVTIAAAADLPAAVIRNLADPAASLGAEPPWCGAEPVAAKGGALAAVALAKLAALLPAALVSRLGPAETALCARRRDVSAIDAEAILKRDAPAAGIERVAEARVPLADAED